MLPERSEQLLEIERSLFASVEYLAMKPEANSKPSPHLQEIESHSAQPRLLLEMPQSRARSLPTHFGSSAVERSSFESAEYLTTQPEANSKPSPHPPAAGSHSAFGWVQPSLFLQMPQSRANFLPKHFGPLAVAKTRARQPEPQAP